MNKKLSIFILMLSSWILIFSQQDNNLIDTSNWVLGAGNIPGYIHTGVSEENSRVSHPNHIGEEVVVWQASPNSGGNSSGGFISPQVIIDHNKMYRMSVWIKKTNSFDGVTSFKPRSIVDGINHTTYLNGDIVTWHPFWNGDLPELNKWYLLVGYVHPSSDNSLTDLGKIYDGVTGEIVLSMRDHKFKTSATELRNQATVWNSFTTLDRQYMYAPRVEEINGNEWTLNQLLSINPNSKLLFAWDNAGNQKQRFYCDNQLCIVPNPPLGRNVPSEDNIVFSKEFIKSEQIIKDDNTLLEEQLIVYPNPTKGIISITLNSKSETTLSEDIIVYNNTGSIVKRVSGNSGYKLDIDLSNLPSGLYIIHFHLSDGQGITKSIIKN